MFEDLKAKVKPQWIPLIGFTDGLKAVNQSQEELKRRGKELAAQNDDLYKGAKAADEGFRLTKLKKGSGLIEDDSLKQQHVTTAIGYWVVYVLERLVKKGVTIKVG